MEIITSTKNQYVKEAKSLCDKKFRDNLGLFLLEGLNIFKDIPRGTEIEYILATEDMRFEIENMLACTRARVYYISRAVLEYVADTINPSGIVAVVKKAQNVFELPHGKALLLDGVSDPGNLGTIIRTAAATDFKEIYLLDTVDFYSPKVVRASLGGIFRIRTTVVTLESALTLVENTQSIVLDMDGEDITKSKLANNVLLVAGSESHGVRREIVEKSKLVKSLPMKNGIESLNVAVALAVAMYQAF